ncbi:hypothetical protein Tco_0045836 [Tanacetum coccineum]
MVKIHTDKNVANLLTNAFDNGIGVNAGDSKLMLLGINLLLLGKVNVARNKLTTAVEMDGKKIIVTEASVRRNLQLNDEEGTYCLPNATIFDELTRIGYEKLSQKLTFYKAFFFPQWKFLIHTILQCLSAKTTAWNEFSITMVSAIICLVTNQKFNFSKYIFESMVKNLDNAGKCLMYPRIKRKDTKISQSSGPTDNVADKAVYKEKDDSLVRVATTATGFYADSGGGPRRQDTMGDTIARSRFENLSKRSNNSLLAGVNTPQSDEDRLKLNELMEFCTKLKQRALDLENTKTAQAQEITSLKLRVKKLEKKEGSRSHKLKRLYKGRKIDDIDKDVEIILVHEIQGSVDEVTLAQALAALKSAKVQEKANVVEELSESITTTPTLTTTTTATTITDVSIRPKAKGLIIHEEEQATTPSISSQQPSQVKVHDKGKGIMVEEPVKKFLKKYQLKLDEEVAQRLQAEFDEQERIEMEKAEANIALKETWDDIQAKIKVDCLLAERLQAREQEELTIEERAKLFQQLLEKRRKFFTAKRSEEKRNRPPTRAQQRSIMSTYLKNMAGYNHNQLKNKSYGDIQKLFDKAMKRVNTFVDMDTELVKGIEVRAKGSETRAEGSSRRAGEDLQQESTKKQKVDDDKEYEELKKCLEIIPDDGDDVTIDATPLSTKSPSIVDYKIYKERKKSYFQIIRVDGNSQMYLTFGKMLKNFNREDLEVLWSIVKARFKKTEPVNYMDSFLLLNLKTMFEDNVWKNQQGLVKVLNWKLYDSCWSSLCKNILYYMLVEKMYPLTNHTLHQMFNDVKLQVDCECEMAFVLLRLIKKQLKEGYVPECSV